MEQWAAETQEHASQARLLNLLCGACVNGDLEAVVRYMKGGSGSVGDAASAPVTEEMLSKHCCGLDAIASPLYYAAGGVDNIKVVTTLLDAYPFLLNLPNKYGSTPLHWAAFNGHIEAVKLFLSKGADANVQSGHADRPLTGACDRGHERIAEVLLASGATMDYVDSDGKSPMLRACAKGHLRVIILLLQVKKKQCKQKGLANCKTLIDANTLAWAANYQGNEENIKSSIRLILEA
jgi:ankyrin repeat protein